MKLSVTDINTFEVLFKKHIEKIETLIGLINYDNDEFLIESYSKGLESERKQLLTLMKVEYDDNKRI